MSSAAVTDRWIAHCRELLAQGRERRQLQGPPRTAWRPSTATDAPTSAEKSTPVASGSQQGVWADGTPMPLEPPLWEYAEDGGDTDDLERRWWDD